MPFFGFAGGFAALSSAHDAETMHPTSNATNIHDHLLITGILLTVTGAERGAQGELLLASRRPGDQETRQIGAGEGEENPDRREQNTVLNLQHPRKDMEFSRLGM